MGNRVACDADGTDEGIEMLTDEQRRVLTEAAQIFTGTDRRRAVLNELAASAAPAPNDDETMMGALFAVLGNVRHAIGLATDAAQDKQRLDWLMRQVCCDEIDGISIEFGLSQDDHYAEFRRQIDAQIARIDPPFGDVGRIDRAGTKGEKS